MSVGREAFDRAVAEVTNEYKGVENGQELLDKIVASFEKTYAHPPVTDFERILGKTFTREEVIVALFQPQEEQVRYYPMVLNVTAHLPKESGFLVEPRTHSMVLSLLYLVHRKSWRFLEEFVVRGGLDVLAAMTNDENLYYRGQVLEVLLAVTDCDKFDWFKPHNGDVTVQTLHNRLLSLADNPSFLTGLLANRTHSYPGGSFRALQILAFWLSWVRAVMTRNQQLTLSAQVLEELRLWGEKKEDGQGGGEDEAQLAQTVYKDFSHDQFQRDGDGDGAAAPGAAVVGKDSGGSSSIGSSGQSGSTTAGYSVSGFEKPQFEGLVVEGLPSKDAVAAMVASRGAGTADSTPSVPAHATDHEKATAAKDTGNACFKSGRYPEALEAYRAALALLQPTTGSATDDAARALTASLQFNVATTLWKIIETDFPPHDPAVPASSSAADGSVELLSQCESACRAALAVDPLHSKAAYRLCAVLLRMKRPDNALATIATTVSAGGGAIDGVLAAMRRQCLAAAVVARRGNGVGGDEALVAATIGARAATYLRALETRSGREKKRVAHAWDGSWTAPAEDAGKTAGNDNDGGGDDDDGDRDAHGAQRHGASETGTVRYAKEAQAIDDAFLIQLMAGKSDDKGKGKDKEKDASGATKASGAKADKKAVKKPATLSRACLEAYNRLKATALAFERQGSGAGTDASAAQRYVADATQALEVIWADGATLQTLLASSLEEPLMRLFLEVATTTAEQVGVETRRKLLRQLTTVDRFATVCRLTLFGSDGLKEALRRYALVEAPSAPEDDAKAAAAQAKWKEVLG